MQIRQITGSKLLLGMALLSFFACTPGPPPQSEEVFARRQEYSAPVVVKAGEPVVHRLSDFPPPKRTSLKDHAPAVVRAADFIVPMKYFNTEQGLAMSSIICSFTDHDGNIWFGTSGNGVSKYDGKSFTNFNSSNGLIHNLINSITQDSRGNIWFGTYGGLSIYDGRTFKNYTMAQGLPNNDIGKILEDRLGNIWICTPKGVSRVLPGGSDGQLAFVNYGSKEGMMDGFVEDVVEDQNGTLWFATHLGVYRYTPAPASSENKLFEDYSAECGLKGVIVKCLAIDSEGTIWFGTVDGAYSFDPARADEGTAATRHYTAADGLTSKEIRSILADKDGNIWFGTTGGAFEYIKKRDAFMNLTTRQGLTNDIVCCITGDQSGCLWFGTLGGGLCRYDGKSIIGFTAEQGLPGTVVYAVTEDKKGHIWFGTNNAGITEYSMKTQGVKGNTFTNYTMDQGLYEDYVLVMIVDHSGNLWMGSPGGLQKFDGTSFYYYTTAQGMVDDYVVSLLEDHLGNIWIGTYEGGVSMFDGHTFTNFTTQQGLLHNTVWDFLDDGEGNLWMATRGGLSIFTGTSFINFTRKQGLADNKLSSVLKDQAGNIILGSWGGGVSVIRHNVVTDILHHNRSINEEGIFENYSTNEGLSNNVVYDLLEDEQGNIFIGTNEGITVLRGGLAPEGKSFARTRLENYNQKAGYPIKDISNNYSMFIDSHGIIWAGTGDKTVRFDYSCVHINETPPHVAIQDVKINNENISWYTLLEARSNHADQQDDQHFVPAYVNDERRLFGRVLSNSQRDTLINSFNAISFDSISPFDPVPQKLVLPYRFNSISFDFVGVETRRPFLVQYQYMLQGFDDKWSPPSDKTTASFGNLPAGSYTFLLKARSPEGVWSEPTAYSFEVLPPWYATWPAYLFYTLVLAAGIYLVDRVQRRRLIARERQRNLRREVEQAKEIEKSYRELKVTQAQLIQAEKMATLGELAAGIAHEIQNPLNFVNNFSEVSIDLLKEMDDEISKGNIAELKGLTADLVQNLEIIANHGRRASAIVRGMVEHSLSSKGEKRPTNINALANEFLKLAYHGFRMKDNSFNASYKLVPDQNLPRVNIAPQDIGRVLLNLINNSFYAVAEKKKQTENGYDPLVTVLTRKLDNQIEIIVKDNGTGIPADILDKIFEPFFSTKTSGQGTGLGLSLSYDIVIAHHGTMEVETAVGQGTEFIIHLPIREE